MQAKYLSVTRLWHKSLVVAKTLSYFAHHAFNNVSANKYMEGSLVLTAPNTDFSSKLTLYWFWGRGWSAQSGITTAVAA